MERQRSRPLIVLADDSATQAQRSAQALEAEGFRVKLVADGRQALEQARRWRPDVIVSDILMPVLDGFGLCREIRRDPALASTPVILYTLTYVDLKDEQFALGLGATRFIVKSIDPRSLVQEIRTVLREGHLIAAPTSTPSEEGFLRGYSERLAAKLEDKVAELEEANRRAIADYRQLLDRLASLGQGLGLARDLPTLFRILLDFVRVSVPCDGLFVSLYDAQQQERVPIYAWVEGEEQDFASLPPMKISESPHSRATATGEVVVTEDLQAALEGQPRVRLAGDSAYRPPQSSVAVPMVMQERVIGTFEVQSVEPAAYTPEHVTALRMAANLAAVAVENVQLLERERAMRTAAETAEQRAREGEEQLRLALAAGRMGTWSLDQSEEHVLLSPETETLLGLAPGSFDGTYEAALALLHPEDCKQVAATVTQAAKREADFTVELRALRPDASVRWLEVHGRAYTDAAGRLQSMLGFVLDVTQRKAAEEERVRSLAREEAARAEATAAGRLAEMRALHEATVLNLTEGLAIVDREERVRFWNPRLEMLYGIPAVEAMGRSFHEVAAPLYARVDDQDAARRQFEVAGAQALAGNATTLEYCLAGDPPVDLQCFVFPILGPEGSLGYGQLVHDVTRERQLDRMKDEVVSVVSHELRTPLAAIIGFSELLLTREWSAVEQREFLGTIVSEGQRLTALLNDFLDLQRLESGREGMNPAPTELRDLLERAVVTMGLDPERPIKLEVPKSLPSVLVDPARIHQVLTNLLSNARKYSPNGGQIRLSARDLGQVVEVSIADRGLGLPLDALPHLFEKFYRVDSAERREIRGTGLGLSISKQIIEAHSGRIWAESAGPKQGSTFRVTLPVA